MSTHTLTRRIALPLHNMTCSSDAVPVERALARTRGVMRAYANPVTEKVYVEYDPALTDEEQILAILRQVD